MDLTVASGTISPGDIGADTLIMGSAYRGSSDWNGDGLADIWTTASPGPNLHLGPISSGSHDSTDGESVITSADEDDYFNLSPGVTGLDVNGDGYSDLLTNAPGSDYPQHNVGTAILFYGPFSGNRCKDDADFRVWGAERDSQLAYYLAAAGDVNQDGMDDFILSSIGVGSTTGDAMGTGWLVVGPVSGTARIGDAAAWQFDPVTTDGGIRLVAGPIDADNDGIPDLLFGLPFANAGWGLAAVVPGASLF